MFNAVVLIATGVWLGAMIFFAAVVAPTVFGTLEPDEASRMIRRVFPQYYLFGLICLSVATLASSYASNTGARITLPLLLMLGMTFYARQVLMPQVNAARDAMLEQGEEQTQEFERLHRRSVQLNTTAMVICLFLLGFLAD